MATNPFNISIETTEGKILVLLQLAGGNDGLNTVVPIEDAKYYNARKTVNIKKEEALKINNNDQHKNGIFFFFFQIIIIQREM